MVKKLLKHEIFSYFRTMFPIYGVLLGIAALGRFIQIFETNGTAYNIVFGSTVFAYVVSIIAAMLLSLIVAVSRYYKNLFTGEGYLSFTLPVTPAQHIWVKLIAALMFTVLSVIAIALSLSIITAGDFFIELIKAAGYMLSKLYEKYGINIVFYAIEILVLAIVMVAYSLMTFYSSITIGQTFKKNRVLAAVGVYFGYYFLTQILGTIVIVIVTVFYDALNLQAIANLIYRHPEASIHVILCLITLFYLIVGTAFFLIDRYIIRNKLNLE